MILGREIIQANKQLIKPFRKKQCQPASYDCLLDTEFIFNADVHKDDVIDIFEKRESTQISFNKYVIIPPLTMVLGSTVEWFRIPTYVGAYVEGKSSIGRSGLFVQNAGFIDPGFEGNITLELFNANNCHIRIPIKMPICQVVFLNVSGVDKGYSGKYVGQEGVTPSRLHEQIE